MTKYMNKYNKECVYDEGVVLGEAVVEFPYVTAKTAFISFTGTTGYKNEDGLVLDEKYGRNIVVKGITTGKKVTVHGQDYYGQMMTEEFSTVTTSTGVKAFKVITKVTYTGTDAITIDTGTKFGLPFASTVAVREIVNGDPKTVGTLTKRNATTQTATSNDPRGLFVPNAVYNAGDLMQLVFCVDNYVDDTVGGGLHGVSHFYAG